jgi:hypothetical protein
MATKLVTRQLSNHFQEGVIFFQISMLVIIIITVIISEIAMATKDGVTT